MAQTYSPTQYQHPSEAQCKQASTPHEELIATLLDSRQSKTEIEHTAAREIERLQAALSHEQWLREQAEDFCKVVQEQREKLREALTIAAASAGQRTKGEGNEIHD